MPPSEAVMEKPLPMEGYLAGLVWERGKGRGDREEEEV
jgi:hypothetical protein